MKKEKSRYNTTRKALIFWCLFIGIGAVAGSLGMLLDPSGKTLKMDAMLPYFQVMPLARLLYQNFTFPGIALLLVNGIPNLIAAVLLLQRKKAGTICGAAFGITLMLWICIQFVIFPLNFMSTIYFIFGIIQAATGYAAWVFYEQEHFHFSKEDYPHIGTNPSELVVYFSRMGYTKKIAYETADHLGADLYEIEAVEHTSGTSGFWWCGRFGMHRWPMPIKPVTVNLSNYEKVTICSPVWVFELCSPMRQFCMEAAGKIRRADYFLVHHQKNTYENAASEMDTLLQLKHEHFTSICCKRGHYLSTMAVSWMLSEVSSIQSATSLLALFTQFVDSVISSSRD